MGPGLIVIYPFQKWFVTTSKTADDGRFKIRLH